MEDKEDSPVVEEEVSMEPEEEPAPEEKVETPPPPPKKSRAAPSEPVEEEPKKRPRKYLKQECPGCGVVCSLNHLKHKHVCKQAAPKAKAKSRPKKRDDGPLVACHKERKVEYEDPAMGMRMLYRELKAQQLAERQDRYAKYFV